MTPDDRRDLENAERRIVTQQLLINTGRQRAVIDYSYWQYLKALGVPRPLAALMAAAQAASS